MLPLYPLNNVTQFHEWRGRIPALTDGVLAAIFRINDATSVCEQTNPPITLGCWVQMIVAFRFGQDTCFNTIGSDYRLNPDAFAFASKVLAMKPDAVCPPKFHFDTQGKGMVLTTKIMGVMGCGEMRIHIPFAQCYADSAFQSAL